MMTDDMELVRDYAAHQSEPAFETLVARYINLVYSAGLRQVGDPHLAGEVTQAVFIILARKAGSLGPKTILPSWLYRASGFVAADTLKTRRRRARREQEAHMQSLLNEPSPGADEAWTQIAPMLDTAIAGLNEKDRHVIVLRFFENHSLAEVGRALGANEDAARMRVNRALEKLRRYFSKRGVSSTTAIIAGVVSANSVQAAPVTLAKSVTAVAIAKGTAASGSTLTLIKGALKLMAWTKAKTAAIAIASVLLAAGTTSVIVTEVRSSVDESLWEMNPENFRKAPPNTLIIRPTRYSDSTSMMGSDGRIIAHNVDLRNLLAYAYSFDDPDGFRHVFKVQRMILSADVPKDHHDLMFTYPYSRLDILQHAIGKKFGCTISKESIETNVLALKIKDPALLAKHVSKKGSKVEFKQTEDLVHWANFPIDSIIYHLEGVFGQPVIEDPGLSGHYDITFQWQDSKTKQQSLTQELAAAGLELVPEVQPVEMLVVEKAKN